jgi:uncharacterized protein YdeI (YjbR/CyaY-like superfamily)
MEPKDVTHFASPAAFRAWLMEYHAARVELWVGYWKKATGHPSITWEESVDEALCFGWIDGIRKRVSEEAYANRFTPRRTGSKWSRRNIDRFRVLEAEGRIQSAGAAAFAEGTEENSRRYSFEQKAPATLTPEYLKRLKSSKDSWADWESRPPGYRKQVIHWIMSAKRESTQERRLAALIEDGAAGRKVKPLR